MATLTVELPVNAPLDVIDYLARSDHRAEVLEAICASPRTRNEVRELVDASRVTVGRILADLEERGWIERDGREYVPTDRGRFVTAEFTRLVANLEAYDSLPPVTAWFPEDEPSFDLAALADATVVTADEGDLIGPIRRSLDLIEHADQVRSVANGASREFVEAMRAAIENGASHRSVLPLEAVDALRADAELRAAVQAMLDSGRFTIHTVDEELPVVLLADETVALCSGDHRCMVETTNVEVVGWAASYFEALWTTGTPVSVETFAVEQDASELEGEAAVE